MPGSQPASPWKPSHERQDFTEQLYLKITLHGFDDNAITSGDYYSKITLDTTAGFFELPNYMNDGMPGPLLGNNPDNHCKADCEPQDYGESMIYNHNVTSHATLNSSASHSAANVTANLLYNVNKGPLLTIALALFGVGSFIDTREGYEAYISTISDENVPPMCLDLVPFLPLLRDFLDQYSVWNSLDPCLRYEGSRFWYTPGDVASYLWAFVFNDYDEYHGERIQNAFSGAAFLANEAWMTQNPSSTGLAVSYDLGADTEVPVISRAGIVVISTLLGLYLLGVLSMALYAARVPRRTDTLDAFAMMRIGAAAGDRVPLLICKDADRVAALDEMPGGFGNATGGEGQEGEVAIGAQTPLGGKREYRSY